MYDLTNFSVNDMYKCAIALRNMDSGCKNMEEVASKITRYLYDHLIDGVTGKRACALARFFKTHPYGDLNEELQRAASEILGGRFAKPSTRCLTLLATAGDEPYWNSRQSSTGHKAIPLIDKNFVERVPMISQLIQQFGLEIETVINPDSQLIADLESHTFNVFYIPEAFNSDYIPAQQNFVVPYQIKSVLGFGGMLPSGNLFAIILFTKTWVSPITAKESFKWISAYARIPVASFDDRVIFKDRINR
jgi:hypothetical protein